MRISDWSSDVCSSDLNCEQKFGDSLKPITIKAATKFATVSAPTPGIESSTEAAIRNEKIFGIIEERLKKSTGDIYYVLAVKFDVSPLTSNADDPELNAEQTYTAAWKSTTQNSS